MESARDKSFRMQFMNAEYSDEHEYCDMRTIRIEIGPFSIYLKKLYEKTKGSLYLSIVSFWHIFLLQIFLANNITLEIQTLLVILLISALQSMNKHNDMYIAIG